MQPMYRYSDEVVARACHAVLDIMNDTHGAPWARVPFAPFASLPPQEQKVVLEGVRAARQGATPRHLFELWAAAKRELGWTWGPVKDTERKTHPNLVDYADLPAPQRDKDQVFLAIVTAMTSVSPRLTWRGRFSDPAAWRYSRGTATDTGRLTRLMSPSVPLMPATVPGGAWREFLFPDLRVRTALSGTDGGSRKRTVPCAVSLL